ncbi:hypothetical protein NBRGN_001_00100 [Nocardia brasiliensis NBRC 14402]|nr:hypothetical protein NBRGN_001_00100 [Nocardia brasiliensis NBRC 14402]SUB40100.1 Uncharacterised protein [Nocardia brasiliensis]
MRPLFMALIYGLILFGSIYVASKGFRGTATSESEGYGEYIPDHLKTDPIRRKQLNRTFLYWGGGGALLCLPPLGYLAYILADPFRELSTAAVVLLAVYGVLITTVPLYPIEKFRSRT